MAEAFKTKKVKKVKVVKEGNIDEDFFYSLFLTLNVKAIPKENFQILHDQMVTEGRLKRSSLIKSSKPSSRVSSTRKDEPLSEVDTEEKQQYIDKTIQPTKRIGNRKKREEKKPPQRVYVIELEDGTCIQTNE